MTTPLLIATRAHDVVVSHTKVPTALVRGELETPVLIATRAHDVVVSHATVLTSLIRGELETPVSPTDP